MWAGESSSCVDNCRDACTMVAGCDCSSCVGHSCKAAGSSLHHCTAVHVFASMP
mgnify:CR=1 FL=1